MERGTVECEWTGECVAGVRIGDCGSKMGLDGIDNGWIQFDHVRVPHSHFLCRYSQVDKNTGTFMSQSREGTQSSNKQMAYGSLIGTRAILVRDAANVMKKGLMIAIRFAAVRKQGEPVTATTTTTTTTTASAAGTVASEAVLLDYRIHQMRLLPLLAAAYAWHFQVSACLLLCLSCSSG